MGTAAPFVRMSSEPDRLSPQLYDIGIRQRSIGRQRKRQRRIACGRRLSLLVKDESSVIAVLVGFISCRDVRKCTRALNGPGGQNAHKQGHVVRDNPKAEEK